MLTMHASGRHGCVTAGVLSSDVWQVRPVCKASNLLFGLHHDSSRECCISPTACHTPGMLVSMRQNHASVLSLKWAAQYHATALPGLLPALVPIRTHMPAPCRHAKSAQSGS